MASMFAGIPDENANTGFARRPSGCQPGMVNLMKEAMTKYQARNLGCFSNASYLNSGGMSWHMYGKAIDPGFDWFNLNERRRGEAWFRYLLDNKVPLGLQQAIWANQIWDVSYGLRAYRRNDHKNHVHSAHSFVASQTWGTGIVVPPKPEVPPEMDSFIMKDAYVKAGQPARRFAVGNFKGARHITDPNEVTRLHSYRFANGASPLDTQQELPVDPVDLDRMLAGK